MPYSRDERADLIFVPAARGPARGNTLNDREPDARNIFTYPYPKPLVFSKPVPDARKIKMDGNIRALFYMGLPI